MSESPDFGGLEPLDAGTGDTDTEPGTEIDVIVYDAEFIDDGTSTDDIIDGEAVDPGMELYDGWLVEQNATVTVEDVSDLPREPQLGGEFEQPTPRVTSDSIPASGVGGGLGGGQLLKRCPRCGRRHVGSCRQARRGGGSGGGGPGGSGGAKYHFSLLGGLHLLSGNRADASVLRAGPIASPSVTGINSSGRRPLSTGSRRPYRD